MIDAHHNERQHRRTDGDLPGHVARNSFGRHHRIAATVVELLGEGLGRKPCGVHRAFECPAALYDNRCLINRVCRQRRFRRRHRLPKASTRNIHVVLCRVEYPDSVIPGRTGQLVALLQQVFEIAGVRLLPGLDEFGPRGVESAERRQPIKIGTHPRLHVGELLAGHRGDGGNFDGRCYAPPGRHGIVSHQPEHGILHPFGQVRFTHPPLNPVKLDTVGDGEARAEDDRHQRGHRQGLIDEEQKLLFHKLPDRRTVRVPPRPAIDLNPRQTARHRPDVDAEEGDANEADGIGEGTDKQHPNGEP